LPRPAKTSFGRREAGQVLELSPAIHGEKRALSVLALGAHADDIEIGCGGLLLRLAEAGFPVRVTWVVLSGSGSRADEARASATSLLGGHDVDVRLGDFRDAFFPHDPGVKEFFEQLKEDLPVDVVLTHTRHDLHQDHRVVCELAWNTFRDHLVLEYEIPKYDGDLGTPNVFVPLEKRHVQRKADVLLEHFETQRDKHWFTRDVFVSLARLRGLECRSPTGYAEAFHGRKLRLALAPS
jgi:LmbE family N-acetylglucosaminyl deacetylase